MTKDELTAKLGEMENVLTVRMQEVRDAWKYAKLGIHVRRQISNELRGMGIGHYPNPLPEYQEQPLRLYKLGTPVAQVIDAVLNPSLEHDRELRQMAEGDAQTTLEQIRALVCE